MDKVKFEFKAQIRQRCRRLIPNADTLLVHINALMDKWRDVADINGEVSSVSCFSCLL